MNDTIAAISTALGVGAISIIRVSGKEALEIGTAYIRNTTECLDAIQSITNALLTVLFTKQYFTLEAEKASEKPQKIAQQLLSSEVINTEVLFAGVETEMETISEEVNGLEALLMFAKEGLQKQIEELLLSVLFKRLLIVQRLSSASTYATLSEETKEEQVQDVKVDEIKQPETKTNNNTQKQNNNQTKKVETKKQEVKQDSPKEEIKQEVVQPVQSEPVQQPVAQPQKVEEPQPVQQPRYETYSGEYYSWGECKNASINVAFETDARTMCYEAYTNSNGQAVYKIQLIY